MSYVLGFFFFFHIVLHTLSLNFLSPAKHFMRLLQLINFWWTFKAFQYGHVRTWYWMASIPLSLLSWGFTLCPTIVLYYFSVLWIFLHCSGFLSSHFCLAGIACSPKPSLPFFFFLPQKLPASSCAFPYETKRSLMSSLITRNVQPKKLFQSLLPPRKDLQWKSLMLLSAHRYLEMFGNLCPYFNETVYFPVLWRLGDGEKLGSRMNHKESIIIFCLSEWYLRFLSL